MGRSPGCGMKVIADGTNGDKETRCNHTGEMRAWERRGSLQSSGGELVRINNHFGSGEIGDEGI